MITLQHIQKSFGAHHVLNDIDLTLKAGTVTALIGPSGSGKSTLLRCINLLEVPDSGTLTLNDARMTFHPGKAPDRNAVLQLRRKTGMVFQNFQLYPHRTVAENVSEALTTVLKWDRARARTRALDLLDKVGIANKADAWPSTLSGGQQQRVAIARALAYSPDVLLCDEPTSALDPALAAEVIDVLKKLAEEGTTMIMATHDLRLAATIGEQVIFLQGGTIVESGTPDGMFNHPKDARTEAFLGALNPP
jgi:cystine transport system ATP-binding protein